VTDGADILAKILAEPADDTARLVYADWLEEHGGQPERAAFIRAGVKKPGTVFADNLPHLITERGAGQFIDRWSRRVARGWLPPPPPGARCDVRFSRGFVREVEGPAAWWLQNGDAITAAHPVERVTLTTPVPVEFGALANRASSYPAERCTYIEARWVAAAPGAKPVEFSRTLVLTDEMRVLGADVREIARFRAQVAEARSPLGYLLGRWPRVRFNSASDRGGRRVVRRTRRDAPR
jgi:uncharacterized protein (TIGR02996 family)